MHRSVIASNMHRSVIGTGLSKCSLSLGDGYDANITSLKGVVGLNATYTVASHNLRVDNDLEVVAL